MSAVTGNTFLIRTANGRFDMLSVSRASLIPPPVTINSVVASASPYTYTVTAYDVSGISITNGVNYKVLSFTSISTTTTYTVNYSCANATTIYVLAVGGGGGGAVGTGGGGCGGGVVMLPINLPSGSSSIVINVGNYGPGNANGTGISGSNTTVTFNANTSANIVAYGGYGGLQPAVMALGTPPNNNNFNYSNYAGGFTSASAGGNGGGGAGTVGMPGTYPSSLAAGGAGGNGIQCFLPGISTFTPSGTSYGTYYWGGGGGGVSNNGATGIGGLGGGGGASCYNGTFTVSGGVGLNNGGTGLGSNGAPGAGGANTGGGGGGLWNGGTSANGGSGIVIIAFPSATPVTSNQSAVLPASIVSSGLYSATLNNATLSSLAYSSIKGAFACRLLNYNYFGPVMTLRHSLDTTGSYTQNFYSDICGNMGTGYLGTGLPLSSWLSANGANTTYAYVTKWYNQGMDVSFNSATQYTTTAQPIYDVANGVMNYGYTGAGGGVAAPQSGYLSLPAGTFPINDSSFTMVTKIWNYSTADVTQNVLAGGSSGNGGFVLDIQGTTPFFQANFNGLTGAGAQINTTILPTNSILTVKYTSVTTVGSISTNTIMYVNGTSNITGAVNSATNFISSNLTIGNGPNTYGSYPTKTLKSQLYYMYLFNTAITDADRNLIERTQSVFSQLPQMTLSLFTLSSTTFAFTWSAVSNATTYIAYINGSAYGAVTSGLAVTPGFSGPWTVNIYAYSATNNLLATGYSATPSTWFKFDTGDIVSTTTLLNYATNTYNGTLNLVSTYPSISTSVSKFGTGSITVNGTSTGYVSMTGVNFSGQMTISFWLQCSSRVDGSPPFSLKNASTYASNSSSGQYMRPWFVGSAAAVTSINVNTSTTDQSVAIASTVNITGWTHFAYVFNNTNIRVYVNGNAGTYTAFHTPLSNGTYTLNIGYENIFGNTPLTGYIDDFRIHNNILSSTQITGIYNYNPIIP